MQTKLLQAPATSDIMKLGFGKRNINKKKEKARSLSDRAARCI